MQDHFMFLTLIIPGAKIPKEKFDVFLQPLIEELKKLWEVGVSTYDVSKKEKFQMKAVLLWSVSNIPAYDVLSGWSTCGRLACPYCMENTKSFALQHSQKVSWFDCHRQFLPIEHPFRQNRSGFFKERVEYSPSPQQLSGDEIWERVSVLPKSMECSLTDMGTQLPGFDVDHNWTKRSIFWDLPYWSKLLVRHNLDIMYIEKKVFEDLFYTIMGVKGRT